MPDVAALELRNRRRGLFFWALGLGLYTLAIVVLYPAFKDDTSLDELVRDAKSAAALFGISGSITSPTGWLNANLYANFFPLIMLVLTIGFGARTLAGEEEDGRLDLVLALPLSRRRVVLEKSLALAVEALALGAATLAFVLVGRWYEMPIDIGHLVTATLAIVLLALDFGLIALAVGAWRGERGVAAAVASGLAAVAYLVSSLAPLVSWLDPLRYGSLFYWAIGDGQLERGMSAGDLAVLAGFAAAALAAALALFARHDIRV